MENSVEFQFETEMSAYRFLNTVKLSLIHI